MIDKKDILGLFKKSYNISYNQDYICCVGGSVNLYDAKSMELVVNFRGIANPSEATFTSDNRLIVKNTCGHYFVYDLASKTLIRKIKPPKGVVVGSGNEFLITSDNKMIIDFANFFPQDKLMFMKIDTGKYTLYDLGDARVCEVFFCKSKSEYYIITHTSKHSDFYSFVYPFDESAFKKLPINLTEYGTVFNFNEEKFVYQTLLDPQVPLFDRKCRLNLYDLHNGLEKYFDYYTDGNVCSIALSDNHKYIATAESQIVQLWDIATGSCLKSYDVDYGCFVKFYDHDSKLLIGTWNKGYCVDISFTTA